MSRLISAVRGMVSLMFVLIPLAFASAQVHKPVKWSFVSVPGKGSEATLMITATLEDGWHIYSQYIEEGGPLPTTISFSASQDYTLVDKVKEEGMAVKSYDKTFMMDIVWYARSVVFSQKVKLHTPLTIIQGKVEFMVCTEEMCLPPEVISFNLETKADKPEKRGAVREIGQVVPVAAPVRHDDTEPPAETPVATAYVAAPDLRQEPVFPSLVEAENTKDLTTPDDASSSSLWGIFIAGFLGGLAAIFMPCIFPMLPFTVGYFTKRSASRKGAVHTAILYGISIIVIYVAAGLGITLAFGSDALNNLSTNGIFNIVFFVLLAVFGASFLGAFEIRLPHAWIDRADAQADRGGVTGIFFMAATLALVSFSCTGPIIGTLLVEAVSVGGGLTLGPILGMTGFSLALALPFTLFAMFPSWLQALPRSGGWLNSVKVVLGFLELALALKFLSNVDLAYHWNWFDREVFLVLWIVLFGALGFYLLGKLRLLHDAAVEGLDPGRLFLALLSLAFALYMVPGLWGAPLNSIAAFLPPQQTQDFDLYTSQLVATATPGDAARKKYDDIFHAPHNLNAYFDYEEGLAYARRVNKPVMIDFTGHACVNCRKMEMTVWTAPDVLQKLREEYVLIQLYVDDRTALQTEQTVSPYSGRTLGTLGNKWSDLQASVFKTNAQPYYVLADGRGTPLVNARGADYDATSFGQFLEAGLRRFQQMAGQPRGVDGKLASGN
ncbi:protein-disulfide reductase DsbD family protein [Parachryseolinea silvisoli]|uniref:protein-disulfide reductase DsbD family protein n=1 Tax=Parachryseolinea silvisoli TaxID=2873601 RepID=UPI002265F2AD|nr:cytochrome c biogenesis protein CcdA [Parachryseolinea silvisoli]